MPKRSDVDDISRDDAPGLSPAPEKRLFLVRHGATAWNKKFRYQGSTDIPLSEEGLLQAQKTALRFKDSGVERVISSPLKRAVQTAEKICKSIGLSSLETWEELGEIDFGDWEGLTVKEIKDKFGPQVFESWRADQIGVAVSGGETPGSFFKRSEDAARRIEEISCKRTLIVAHGAIFRVLLLPLIGLPRINVFWKMRMDNCSISAVDTDKKGRRSIAFFNDTLHLKADPANITNLPLW